MKKKVVVLSTNSTGNVLNHRWPLIEGILNLGHQVHLIVPQDSRSEELRALPCQVHFVEMSRKGMNPFSELRSLIKYLKILREIKPDVYLGFTIKPVLYGTWAATLTGVPRILNTVTGLGHVFISNKWGMLLARQFVKVMYRILFASERVQVVFQNRDDLTYFIDEKLVHLSRTSLIPGAGVDLQRFSYTQPPSFEDGKIRILFPSRLLVEKGVHDLLTAAKLMREARSHFQLRLCGDVDEGNPASLTQREVESYKGQDDMVWLGPIAKMESEYQNCHIVCLPSYREGLPLSLLEACASGRPIVTTDVPGCREVVDHEKNGFLVPVHNPEKLAEALLKMIADGRLREKMGALGRQKAETVFAKEKIVHDLLQQAHLFDTTEDLKRTG